MIYNPNMKKFIQRVFWKVVSPVSVLVIIWMMLSGWPTGYIEGFTYVAFVMIWILTPVTLHFLATTVKFNIRRNEKNVLGVVAIKLHL